MTPPSKSARANNATEAKRDPALVRRARRIYRTLEQTYPAAHCALDHRNAFELLVATILSAQCTDERVNLTTPALFARYPTPEKMAAANQPSIEKLIRSCGFFRNKAKSIRGAAAAIVEQHDGQVPQTMDELLALPGVARKTANVILGNAFNINVGVVVDTHVKRLAHRMALTDESTPDKIERDLMTLFPRNNWCMLSHLLIWHGRQICSARKPDCDRCPILKQCPQRGI